MALVGERREVDVIVLGGGTGGYSAALRAAGLGLEVALVERDLVGGTCLHRGCIPSKALLHAAEIMDSIEEGAKRWGIHTSPPITQAKELAASRDDVVDRNYNGLLAHLSHDGVAVMAGIGRVTSPKTVIVAPVDGAGGEQIELTARRGLVIATGSKPRQLRDYPSDGHVVLTSDDATRSDNIPRSVLVIGAGAIGVEFATFYRAFGADVTIVEALSAVLPGEDPDVSKEIARALKRKGITVDLEAQVVKIEKTDVGATVTVRDAKQEQKIDVEVVLVAIGRVPVTEGFGLEELGVNLDRGFVVPADWSRLETNIPGVFAVGDILTPPSLALAHASFAEGLLVAEALAGMPGTAIDYAGVPRATYSLPEAASVGLSEPEARERGFDVVVNRFPLTGVAKGLIYGQGGMVKIVAERDGKVLGVHMVGPKVTELIAEGMLITNWEALASEVAEWIHPHPSLSEAIGEAHLTLAGRRLHQQGS